MVAADKPKPKTKAAEPAVEARNLYRENFGGLLDDLNRVIGMPEEEVAPYVSGLTTGYARVLAALVDGGGSGG